MARQIDPALGELRADERKFKQILVNLLSNAVKFTPDGGSALPCTRAIASGCASRSPSSDTGIGIAPEDQEAVFEEFRQVGRDYTNKQEGTGLGPRAGAQVRRAARRCGSACESEPGKGLRSHFTIPWVSGMSRILIIEDNEKHEARPRRAAGEGLRDHGGGQCRGGPRALVKLHRLDLVLMDIQLPGMNGIEALECLRAPTKRQRRFRSIAVTASVMHAGPESDHRVRASTHSSASRSSVKEFLDTR